MRLIESDKYKFDIHWYEYNSIQYDVKLKENSEFNLYPDDSKHEQVKLTQYLTYTNVIEKLANAVYDLNDISDGDEFV